MFYYHPPLVHLPIGILFFNWICACIMIYYFLRKKNKFINQNILLEKMLLLSNFTGLITLLIAGITGMIDAMGIEALFSLSEPPIFNYNLIFQNKIYSLKIKWAFTSIFLYLALLIIKLVVLKKKIKSNTRQYQFSIFIINSLAFLSLFAVAFLGGMLIYGNSTTDILPLLAVFNPENEWIISFFFIFILVLLIFYNLIIYKFQIAKDDLKIDVI